MKVVKPSCVHERIATTRISRLIAPTMVRAPDALARARAAAGGGAESRGSTATSSPATSRPGTSIPRLPAGPKPMSSAVISGGPSAIPTLPPVEKMETPVALRSPATAVAVRYPSGW